MNRKVSTYLGAGVVLAAVAATATTSQAAIIADFSGGVTAVNHPNPADGGTNALAPTYHDISQDAFATPSAGTLNGSPALAIADGGFTNGVYSIYSAVVPATGLYTVSADMLVNDTATSQMTLYQMGVIVNGAHRGANPSKIANATIFADYTGLTSGVLDATTTQNIVTQQFSANAGDSLLIAFSTDVTSGYDSNAGNWNSASVLVDNISLNVVPEPASAAVLGLGAFGLAASRRRRHA
jgi:hypothetical protein